MPRFAFRFFLRLTKGVPFLQALFGDRRHARNRRIADSTQSFVQTLLVGRSVREHRSAKGIEAKVNFVEVRVQLGGRLLDSTSAFCGDVHDPCPEGQELL